MRPVAVALAAALLLCTSAGLADRTAVPETPEGLTIPELVARLEAAGYRQFVSVESDQRKIVVEAETPSGQPRTIMYWITTGRTLVLPQDGPGEGDG